MSISFREFLFKNAIKAGYGSGEETIRWKKLIKIILIICYIIPLIIGMARYLNCTISYNRFLKKLIKPSLNK